ncbi:hypothetical protein PFISCL1PPCAC_13455, partial [Pristionchus fissidentatus]
VLRMVGYDSSSTSSNRELSSSEHSLAGLASGVATRALGQPLDVLKIRFQLQEEPIGGQKSGKYRGVIQSIRLIAREEGVRAFWKGHVPAQGLSAVFGLVQFSAYEWCSKRITVAGHVSKAASDFVAGTLAGSLAMTASMPLDVIRTRLVAQAQMSNGDTEGPRRVVYRGTLHAITTIGRTQGPVGYFRGWLPSVAIVAPSAGLQFWFYNAICARLDALTDADGSSSSNRLVAGAAAGALARTLLYPLDIMRHRLQMNGFERASFFGATSDYSIGLARSVAHVARTEGVRGMFKGLWPSQLKSAVSSGLAFFFYEVFCDLLRARHGL